MALSLLTQQNCPPKQRLCGKGSFPAYCFVKACTPVNERQESREAVENNMEAEAVKPIQSKAHPEKSLDIWP